MRSWYGWLFVLGLLGHAGCDRFKSVGESNTDDSARMKCREACGNVYKACTTDCKNDAPEACEGRCDKQNLRCNEKCDGN